MINSTAEEQAVFQRQRQQQIAKISQWESQAVITKANLLDGLAGRGYGSLYTARGFEHSDTSKFICRDPIAAPNFCEPVNGPGDIIVRETIPMIVEDIQASGVTVKIQIIEHKLEKVWKTSQIRAMIVSIDGKTPNPR